jgi:hypothetical protein
MKKPEPETWAKESYDIAVRLLMRTDLYGTPRGPAKGCRAVNVPTYVSNGYPARARLIANRKMYLAGYR